MDGQCNLFKSCFILYLFSFLYSPRHCHYFLYDFILRFFFSLNIQRSNFHVLYFLSCLRNFNSTLFAPEFYSYSFVLFLTTLPQQLFFISLIFPTHLHPKFFFPFLTYRVKISRATLPRKTILREKTICYSSSVSFFLNSLRTKQ